MIIPHKALIYSDDGNELLSVRAPGSRSQAVYNMETMERASYNNTIDQAMGRPIVGLCDMTFCMEASSEATDADFNDVWTTVYSSSGVVVRNRDEPNRFTSLGRYDHPNNIWGRGFSLSDAGRLFVAKVDPASVAERGIRKNKAGVVITKNPMHNTPFREDWAERATVCGNLVQFLRTVGPTLAEGSKEVTQRNIALARQYTTDYNTMVRECTAVMNNSKELRETALRHRETAAKIAAELPQLMSALENSERVAGLLTFTASPWTVYRRTLGLHSIEFEDGIFTAKGTDGSVLLSVNYNVDQPIWKDKNLAQLQSILFFRTHR